MADVQVTMFDPDAYRVVPPPAPKVSTDMRRRQRQAAVVAAGSHPLSVALRRHIPLHPDAPRALMAPPDRPGPRCGTCWYRKTLPYHSRRYAKCCFTEAKGPTRSSGTAAPGSATAPALTSGPAGQRVGTTHPATRGCPPTPHDTCPQWTENPMADTDVYGTDVHDWDEFRNAGLLWLINRVVFHPRGWALALVQDGGDVVGWRLLGAGTDVWRYDEDERDLFRRVQRTLMQGTSIAWETTVDGDTE